MILPLLSVNNLVPVQLPGLRGVSEIRSQAPPWGIPWGPKSGSRLVVYVFYLQSFRLI